MDDVDGVAGELRSRAPPLPQPAPDLAAGRDPHDLGQPAEVELVQDDRALVGDHRHDGDVGSPTELAEELAGVARDAATTGQAPREHPDREVCVRAAHRFAATASS